MIGGTGTGAGNVISGNRGGGVYISAGALDIVAGNLIGTNATGSAAIGNGGDGVELADSATGNTIGGLTSVPGSGAGNLISGNVSGVTDFSAGDNVFEGNLIGLQAGGLAALSNTGGGINAQGIGDTIGGTAAGAGNVISGNMNFGVAVSTGFAVGVSGGIAVVGNLIGTDLDGSVAVPNAVGVSVGPGENTIGGTITAARNVISGNTGDGIEIGTEPGLGSDTLIEGNSIGLDSSGTLPLRNGGDGIDIPSPPYGSTSNTIGGTVAGSGNVISANALAGIVSNGEGDLIEGNHIGTDYTGTTSTNMNGEPLGNLGGGISDAGGGDTIGGLTSGARNIIGGNAQFGISLGSLESPGFHDVVVGNYIGTDATGTVALSNDVGVMLTGEGITIGGTASGAGNLISGNTTGISDAGGMDDVILGNFIGTDADGTAALGNTADGIDTTASGDTIGGTGSVALNLISGNGGDGIQIGYGPGVHLVSETGEDNLVAGNRIGTDVTGTVALPDLNGVMLDQDATGNTIGGTASGAGNVISGNTGDGVLFEGASDNAVVGNRIGTDQSGAIALGNQSDGIELEAVTSGLIIIGGGIVIQGSDGNTIGGTAPGAGNVISANAGDGVLFEGASDNAVAGNFIGTDQSGEIALGNQSNGIKLESVTFSAPIFGGGTSYATQGSTGNTIGGTTAGARNIISGNDGAGVYLNDSTGNLVEGDYIGTDKTGTVALGNNSGGDESVYSGGVLLDDGSGSNTIGGLTAIPGTGAGNVISGNGSSGVHLEYAGSGNLIAGNLIGADANGTVALSNTLPLPVGNVFAGTGVSDEYSPGTTIGEVGGSNVISGNGTGTDNASDIYMVGSSGSVIQSNFIGTDVTGTVSLSESTNIGIYLQDGSYTVGGLTSTPGTGPGNVISGQSEWGIRYDDYTAPETLLVEGNILGADKTGENELPNGLSDIVLFGASLVTIGGTAAGARNLITGGALGGFDGDIWLSGSSDNVIQGNYVGTDITGMRSLYPAGGNGGSGVYMDAASADNLVGGTTAAARNIIAGSDDPGVDISDAGSSRNLIEGDFIGTDVSGTAAIGNTGAGVEIGSGASGNTIGGTVPAAANLISGNTNGVEINDASQNLVQGNMIGTDIDAARSRSATPGPACWSTPGRRATRSAGPWAGHAT